MPKLFSSAFTITCIFMILLVQNVDSKLKGFRLKLINVVVSSRKIELENYSINPTNIRPPAHAHKHILMVQMNLGYYTNTPVSLLLDTGSNFVWTQCQPCKHCFQQNAPIFNPSNSMSYRKLPPNNQFSSLFNCTNRKFCTYKTTYDGGGQSKGVVSIETFGMRSNTGSIERINNIIFGCGNDNRLPDNSFRGDMTGVLGMDKLDTSFIRQIGRQSSALRRFSYCPYEVVNATRNKGFLRFGDDIVIANQSLVRKTPFLNIQQYSSRYVVKLLGVSIGRSRLQIQAQPCIVDSGYASSAIEQRSFSTIFGFLVQYFSRFNLTRDSRYRAQLCYIRPRDFNNFPTMTFHFQDADLEIMPTSLFLIRPQIFCLAMRGQPNKTVLGAIQQRNHRFVFDLGENKLCFIREDCSRDGN